MIGAFRVYMGVAWAEFVAYRVVFFLYSLWAIVPPLIYLAIWSTIAGGQAVGSFSSGDFVAYYLAFMVVNQLTTSIEIHTVEWEIRQGNLSSRLLLPVHPAIRPLTSNLGYKGIGMFVVVPSVLLLAALFHPHFHTNPGLLVLAVLAVAMAGMLQFLVGISIASLAFWITRADAVNQLHETLLFLLSGQLAPLALLPDLLHTAAVVLPYRYMLSFPVEVATGNLSAGATVLGFVLQILWLVSGFALFRLIWGRGVRHYSAVGG